MSSVAGNFKLTTFNFERSPEWGLMTQKLPIFPLNMVLFPGAPIQLHIFEERYRLMIGRCLEQSSPFGVALIRSGSEVSPDDPWVRRQLELADAADKLELGALKRELGGETVPYSVGTTAQSLAMVRNTGLVSSGLVASCVG